MFSLPLALLLFAQPVTGTPDMTGMAQGILQKVDLARQALAAGDQQAARNFVDQALSLSADIRRNTGDQPLMVPLSSERDTVSTYAPVKKGKGDTLTAKRMKRETSVRQVEGQITSVSLNVLAAENHLQNARAALDSHDPAAADAALQAVQGDVIQRTVAAEDLPLLRARENLMLARQRVVEDKPKDARTPLRAAAQALADFQRTSLGPHARDAVDLRREIDAYADVINKQDKEISLPRIDAWLDTLNGWQLPQ